MTSQAGSNERACDRREYLPETFDKIRVPVTKETQKISRNRKDIPKDTPIRVENFKRPLNAWRANVDFQIDDRKPVYGRSRRGCLGWKRVVGGRDDGVSR